jgi:hypothetical protein
MSDKDKGFYTAHLVGITHAIVSSMGSAYCLWYADGKPGTSWFNSYEYVQEMYDIQKYLHLISISYVTADTITCMFVGE